MVLDIAPIMANNTIMPKRKHATLSDQLRQIVRDSEYTRYAISKATGIDQAVLCKFVHGERGLSFDSLDLLGKFLEIDLVAMADCRGISTIRGPQVLI